jgi:hypothetical protein
VLLKFRLEAFWITARLRLIESDLGEK